MIGAGVDVSKAQLHAAVHGGTHDEVVNNDSVGIKHLVDRLEQNGVDLVVVEATGGYERPLVRCLWDRGIDVSLVNPRKTRSFAKATGKLAKTDKVDAQILARFAVALTPRATPSPERADEELRELSRTRKYFVQKRVALTNRLAHEGNEIVQKVHEATIEVLTASIKELDAEIKRVVAASTTMRDKQARLMTIPGVGQVVSTSVLSELPEIETLNAKEAAALAGLAPFNNDSGEHRGKRTTWGGRPHLRSILYMAAVSAIQFNPTIRAFYERLLARGKAKKVALIACARKLLITMASMLKHEEDWRVDYEKGVDR